MPKYVGIQAQGPRNTKRSNIFQLCTFHWVIASVSSFHDARERCV